MIKIGFFDKINYSMIVNTSNKSVTEDTVKYFSRMSRTLVHSTNICFTASMEFRKTDRLEEHHHAISMRELDENDQFEVC